jgi:uncharacterized protein (UPF0333 family)
MNKNRLRKKPLTLRQRLACVNSMKKFANETNLKYNCTYSNLFSKYDPFYMANDNVIDYSPCSMWTKILTPKNQD